MSIWTITLMSLRFVSIAACRHHREKLFYRLIQQAAAIEMIPCRENNASIGKSRIWSLLEVEPIYGMILMAITGPGRMPVNPMADLLSS